jgi:hypothetical protein
LFPSAVLAYYFLANDHSFMHTLKFIDVFTGWTSRPAAIPGLVGSSFVDRQEPLTKYGR